ncbi:hypothetical protein EC968_003160, partial [Mortierella alpina]
MATPKLIVLCDGTWCGAEARTETNVYRLAEMIMNGNNPYNTSPTTPYRDRARNITACYFPGAGIGGTFLEYLFNGATGDDIDDDCIQAYKYIVEHYTPEHEIWMFGLSRGAYTVRCVAGMINNCGILKLLNVRLCDQVYSNYRSRLPTYDPSHSDMNAFRKAYSHEVPTPVKFMGLIDTVGALGIPYLNPGIGLTHLEFHDTRVSTVVEKLLNAPQFEIHERWFPGCHYDLGRQRFRFLRNGRTLLERALGFILNPLSNVIEPNLVFANVVLKWMLDSISQHDPSNTVIPAIPNIIAQLEAEMVNPQRNTGSGDIYDNLPAFGPAGRLWGYLTALFPVRFIPGFTATIVALTRTRNRTIADPVAVLTLYDQQCPQLGDTVGVFGRIGPTVPW